MRLNFTAYCRPGAREGGGLLCKLIILQKIKYPKVPQSTQKWSGLVWSGLDQFRTVLKNRTRDNCLFIDNNIASRGVGIQTKTIELIGILCRRIINIWGHTAIGARLLTFGGILLTFGGILLTFGVVIIDLWGHVTIGGILLFLHWSIGAKVLLGVIINNWGQDYHFLGARFYWGWLSTFGSTIISNEGTALYVLSFWWSRAMQRVSVKPDTAGKRRSSQDSAGLSTQLLTQGS